MIIPFYWQINSSYLLYFIICSSTLLSEYFNFLTEILSYKNLVHRLDLLYFSLVLIVYNIILFYEIDQGRHYFSLLLLLKIFLWIIPSTNVQIYNFWILQGWMLINLITEPVIIFSWFFSLLTLFLFSFYLK